MRSGCPLILAGVIALALAAAAHSYWRVSQPYLVPGERAPAYRMLAWDSLRSTWLFAQQVEFAELALTPVTAASAPHVWALVKPYGLEPSTEEMPIVMPARDSGDMPRP